MMSVSVSVLSLRRENSLLKQNILEAYMCIYINMYIYIFSLVLLAGLKKQKLHPENSGF